MSMAKDALAESPSHLFLTSLTVTIRLQNVLSEVSKKKERQQIKKKIKHFLVY